MIPRIVDGSTQVLGIIGDPIRQVRAPEIWSALFRLNGVNAVCVPLHVKPRDLAGFFAGIRDVVNLAGLIVTMDHQLAEMRAFFCFPEGDYGPDAVARATAA